MKDNLNQYIDVLICFCRYYLISKKMPHSKENIRDFLQNTKTKSIIKMANGLEENTLCFDIWQIFSVLEIEDIDNIKERTILRLTSISREDKNQQNRVF